MRRPRAVTYRGVKYRLLYVGDTPYGRRARLAFLDGSRTFWVDADSVDGPSRRAAFIRRCADCGRIFKGRHPRSIPYYRSIDRPAARP